MKDGGEDMASACALVVRDQALESPADYNVSLDAQYTGNNE